MIDTLWMVMVTIWMIGVTIWMYFQIRINKNNNRIHTLMTKVLRLMGDLHKEEAEALGLMPKKKRGRPRKHSKSDAAARKRLYDREYHRKRKNKLRKKKYQKEYYKEYYKKNREKILKQNTAYVQTPEGRANKLAYDKKYYKKHGEKMREQMNARNAKHRK